MTGFAIGTTGAGLAASSTAINDLPSPEKLPVHTVAVVSHIPVKSRTITIRELGQAVVESAAQAGLRSAPSPGQPGYKEIEEEALGELLDGLWIQGQAAEMGISASDGQIAAELARIKEANFKTKREFQAFLRDAHFTLREVRYRVRLQLLSAAIQERVAAGARNQKSLHKVFAAFVAAYEKRWQSRTVCAQRYAFQHCSNG